MQNITIESTAFDEGGMIPVQYTCDGKNVSPPMQWSEPPEGTQSIALICDDPDAASGDWVHWVIYNIPAASRGLPGNFPLMATLPDGTVQGMTDFRSIGYGGPCPPSGAHRYYFKIYALDTKLSYPSGITKQQLLKAMEGHILAQGQLMGKYTRRR
ncbi:MAG: YbhB/YbcL family Raf kinase inhibitor-like protein [Candidatus Latescibacteria bacterium]|nr:YbhB/YbcL family Raf kinase inhibitor-like protein [Candidatus Latescibacterota bacterium]